MQLWQISNDPDIFGMVVIFSELHFHLLFISNREDKVLIIIEI